MAFRGNAIPTSAALSPETPVLNTTDGEPGRILSAIAYDPGTGRWTEYAVSTQYGIERWSAEDFIVRDDDEASETDSNA